MKLLKINKPALPALKFAKTPIGAYLNAKFEKTSLKDQNTLDYADSER